MDVKEAFNFIVKQLYNKSSCGRLDVKERDAIRIVRRYLEDGNTTISQKDKWIN